MFTSFYEDVRTFFHYLTASLPTASGLVSPSLYHAIDMAEVSIYGNSEGEECAPRQCYCEFSAV